jgi:protein AroM
VSAVRIGAVTIGQSPRDDVVPELEGHLGGDVEIVQRGALDGVTIEVIRANAPLSGETTLVSRLENGSEVAVDMRFVEPRLQQQICSLEEQGIQLILLLCTHRFEGLSSNVTLLRPASVLERLVEMQKVRRLGVFTPSAKQTRAQRIRWRAYALEGIRVSSASPYLEGSGIKEAAATMRDKGVDIAVMDCIGYTEEMRSLVQGILNVPVYSAVSALGDAAAEAVQKELRKDHDSV